MKPQIRLTDVMSNIVAKTSTKILSVLQAVDPTITAVHYEYGHLKDVRERQMAKTLANPMATRYPLVWLIEDFRTTQELGLFGVSDVKIMILHNTKTEYTRVQREQLVFLPILVPIYNALLYQMKISGMFMQYGPFSHVKIDRPHWGNPEEWGNKGYLFDEPLDGIELSELELKIYLANCVIA